LGKIEGISGKISSWGKQTHGGPLKPFGGKEGGKCPQGQRGKTPQFGATLRGRAQGGDILSRGVSRGAQKRRLDFVAQSGAEEKKEIVVFIKTRAGKKQPGGAEKKKKPLSPLRGERGGTYTKRSRREKKARGPKHPPRREERGPRKEYCRCRA